VVDITATAKSSYFNTSIRSNTVLWWKRTSSGGSTSSGTKLTKPSIFVNAVKKTLSIIDSNSTSYTQGYNIFRNGELILSTTTSKNNAADRVIDISNWLDFSEGEYF
jgi:hypothetical protein